MILHTIVSNIMWQKKYKKEPDLLFIVFLIPLIIAIRWPLILIPIILVIVGIWYFKRSQFKSHSLKKEEENFTLYKKKKSQITQAEMVFYKALKEVVQDRYDIQRQVVISSIIDVTSENIVDHRTGRWFNPERSKIDRKTIDFVLFNKETLEPYMAIELDDISHELPLREKRDHFVDTIMERVGLKIEHIRVSQNYNVEEIRTLTRKM